MSEPFHGVHLVLKFSSYGGILLPLDARRGIVLAENDASLSLIVERDIARCSAGLRIIGV